MRSKRILRWKQKMRRRQWRRIKRWRWKVDKEKEEEGGWRRLRMIEVWKKKFHLNVVVFELSRPRKSRPESESGCLHVEAFRPPVSRCDYSLTLSFGPPWSELSWDLRSIFHYHSIRKFRGGYKTALLSFGGFFRKCGVKKVRPAVFLCNDRLQWR